MEQKIFNSELFDKEKSLILDDQKVNNFDFN